jgi:predicted Fe-Mo cluster-binding NifX family protein
MKMALPVAGGKATQHFGHCEVFSIFEVDMDKKTIISSEDKTPPEHIPGIFPEWVAKLGVTLVISGGMGTRAQNLFKENNVDLILGIESYDPKQVVQSYLDGTLKYGTNSCGESGPNGHCRQ